MVVTSESAQEESEMMLREKRIYLTSLVLNDHSYASPYPTYSLENKNPAPYKFLNLMEESKMSCTEDNIDIVNVETLPSSLVRYDSASARSSMLDVDQYLNSLWKDVSKNDKEKFNKGNWSKEQTNLFEMVYKTINNYQLAKLTYEQNENEPVLRKLALEKATKRLRKAFGFVFWKTKLVVWLHGIILDGLGSSLFLCYLEILQMLKRKVPELIEQTLLSEASATEKENMAGLPNLTAHLRKTWDPSIALTSKLVMEKFPTLPLLLSIPCGPVYPGQSCRRTRFWTNQFLSFSKPVNVNVPPYHTTKGYALKLYIEHCINLTRLKIYEYHRDYPNRQTVLIGWGVGAVIAFKVGLIDRVDAIICLGFPSQEKEETWGSFASVTCPVLFLIGTRASSECFTSIEKLRQSMKVSSNLILVEGADEMLRLPTSVKRKLGMTQNMVDVLIQNEMYMFLKSALFPPKHFPMKEHRPPKTKKKIVVDSKRKKQTFKGLKASNQMLTLDIKMSQANENALFMSPGLLTTSSTAVTSSVRSSHTVFPTSKTGQKRKTESKPNVKAPKKMKPLNHTFTAKLGSQRSGNLGGQLFSSGSFSFANTSNRAREDPTSVTCFTIPVTSGLNVIKPVTSAGKQTILVQPTSRFVINNPTSIVKSDANSKPLPGFVHSRAQSTSTNSTIMSHITANDLRYLATLLAKQSSFDKTSAIPSTATEVSVSAKSSCDSKLVTTSLLPMIRPTNILVRKTVDTQKKISVFSKNQGDISKSNGDVSKTTTALMSTLPTLNRQSPINVTFSTLSNSALKTIASTSLPQQKVSFPSKAIMASVGTVISPTYPLLGRNGKISRNPYIVGGKQFLPKIKNVKQDTTNGDSSKLVTVQLPSQGGKNVLKEQMKIIATASIAGEKEQVNAVSPGTTQAGNIENGIDFSVSQGFKNVDQDNHTEQKHDLSVKMPAADKSADSNQDISMKIQSTVIKPANNALSPVSDKKEDTEVDDCIGKANNYKSSITPGNAIKLVDDTHVSHNVNNEKVALFYDLKKRGTLLEEKSTSFKRVLRTRYQNDWKPELLLSNERTDVPTSNSNDDSHIAASAILELMNDGLLQPGTEGETMMAASSLPNGSKTVSGND